MSEVSVKRDNRFKRAVESTLVPSGLVTIHIVSKVSARPLEDAHADIVGGRKR